MNVTKMTVMIMLTVTMMVMMISNCYSSYFYLLLWLWANLIYVSGPTGSSFTQDMHRSHGIPQTQSISSANTQPGSATDTGEYYGCQKMAFSLS
jgi:uncharacterized membrane protein